MHMFWNCSSDQVLAKKLKKDFLPFALTQDGIAAFLFVKLHTVFEI